MTETVDNSNLIPTPSLEVEHREMSESLGRFFSFMQLVQAVKQSHTTDEALDQMELLLDQAVDFLYAQVLLKDTNGGIEVVREMIPDGLAPDWLYVQWALDNQEIAVIPVDEREPDDPFSSLLLLPLVGNTGSIGIVILWVDFDASEFNQEQSTLLTMLGRETATVIETHIFRKRIESTNAILSDVMEAVPHGVLGLDNERRVILVNSTMEFMLAVRRNDVIGVPYHECLPQEVVDLLTRMIHAGGQEEEELTIPIGGVDEMIGMQVTPIQVGTRGQSGYVVLCRDLKLSREVTKLREIDSMKNDFLSLVSHELRTPLTSILAYTETLLMEGMVESEEERTEYLQIIYDEGERLTRLINDVLDLTKMEAGKMEYIYEERDANEVARNALLSSSSLAQQKGLKLEEDFATDMPLVRLDADRIMQVLMNFLSNAIKFTPEGGCVTLSTKRSDPLPDSVTETVTLSVTDTGIGISRENLNKVFSKFEQIESIDHHSIGTGLGMPICKQIIEEGHGGEVGLESELGKGSTFFIRIPIA